MKVLVLHSGGNAIDYHRLVVPFANINENFDDIEIYSKNHLEADEHQETVRAADLINWGIDIVVFSRNISIRFDPLPVFKQIKAAGCKIVIDIDDHWELSPSHYLAKYYKEVNLTKCIIDQIIHSDAVITTHQLLKDEILKIAPKQKVYIATNGIDPNQEQFQITNLTHDNESIYWQGGISHYNDLKLLRGALNGLIDYKLTIGGYNQTDENSIFMWNRIMSLFNKDNAEYDLARNVDEYARRYWNKGICVTPLLNNKFNRMKSELKIIEAGWFAKPVIASYVHPYNKMPHVTFCENKSDWAGAIKYHLENPNFQIDMGQQLAEYVREKYVINKVNENRLKCLIDMYGKR
jgi:glycosyltransferase involved in cell wall biosynthesis